MKKIVGNIFWTLILLWLSTAVFNAIYDIWLSGGIVLYLHIALAILTWAFGMYVAIYAIGKLYSKEKKDSNDTPHTD